MNFANGYQIFEFANVYNALILIINNNKSLFNSVLCLVKHLLKN